MPKSRLFSLVIIFIFNVQIVFANELSLLNNPFQYSAQYSDHESGLQYLNARYYNPAVKRFVSRDSFQLLNRYVYADGNPVMNEDPSGHIATNYFISAPACGLGFFTTLAAWTVNKATAFMQGLALFSMAAGSVALALTAHAYTQGAESSQYHPLQQAALALAITAYVMALSDDILLFRQARINALEENQPLLNSQNIGNAVRIDSEKGTYMLNVKAANGEIKQLMVRSDKFLLASIDRQYLNSVNSDFLSKAAMNTEFEYGFTQNSEHYLLYKYSSEKTGGLVVRTHQIQDQNFINYLQNFRNPSLPSVAENSEQD